ncbi:UDP-glucuronosyl UDP-glucosyltransferase [Colletotrichum chrysophilum]|uniref:UDP-glucuronosyl UDP-glucosyltransferase n=1 Tax=Colletotrichum chrysophilum TaxID=1836956 RepID=A0AAD9EA29_9PEZI|nr:UDP-glucuronosyl UDP-glucosyltransferase [Colletotrichum chrysophilum]
MSTANVRGLAPVAQTTPFVLMSAIPTEGHLNPILEIASHLVKQGFDVAVMSTIWFQHKVEATGAEWIPIPDPNTDMLSQRTKAATLFPVGPERFAAQIECLFADLLPVRTQQTEDVLVAIQGRDMNRRIIFIEEVLNWSFVPFRYGRPRPAGLPRMPKSIAIGNTVLVLETQDADPGVVGPNTHCGTYEKLNTMFCPSQKSSTSRLLQSWTATMRTAGCEDVPSQNIFKSCYEAYDAVLQLCSPSLEPPGLKLPSPVRFIGTLPRPTSTAVWHRPLWWQDVEAYSAQSHRHVIFVAQGTVNLDYHELIVPCMAAFSERDDILLIVSLGASGALLHPEVTVPGNVRVADYLPYDVILAHADVFVSNGGYGSLCHAVRNGVPVVFAGESEDKNEVSMRAAIAGLGIALFTQRPAAEQIRLGVEEVLSEARFKNAALKLKLENDGMNALLAIEEELKT